MPKAEDIQREYYLKISEVYDSMHVNSGDEHYVSLKYISGFLDKLSIFSILDVGCGTGRGVKYFMEHHPEIEIKGVEPVLALIDQAIKKNNIPEKVIICAKGENLPFDDNSFDAVCEFGILHHVDNPNIIVSEMMRVAKKPFLYQMPTDLVREAC